MRHHGRFGLLSMNDREQVERDYLCSYQIFFTLKMFDNAKNGIIILSFIYSRKQ